MKLVLKRAQANVQLGQKLAQGGEGEVFAIEGQADRVAKIYSTIPDQHKVEKLVAMTEVANEKLLRIAAWPIDLLLDSDSRRIVGFVMPRIAACRDIHELYSPKSRWDAFPDADFRFLVHVGANIARAFAVVHDQGHVIGDVNQRNLLVNRDGTVALIDCDSFQIGTASNMFTCDVGVDLFTAPELQGQPFRGRVRTKNHDLFGVAVLLFHLLFMGRHPFAGRYSGSGDMPIEKAIAEYRFAYGPDRASYGMERPPGTIPLETMGDEIVSKFVQSFGRNASNGGRPDARSWIEALERLKANLRICSSASWHHYPHALGTSCPWCVLEKQSSVRLFGQRIIATGPTGVVNIEALWQAIAAVPDPGADPALPSQRQWRPPRDIDLPSGKLKNFRKVASVVLLCSGLVACNVLAKDGGLVLALLAYGVAFAVWPRVSVKERSAAESEYATANAEWQNALERWGREASRTVFEEKIKSLEAARAKLVDLPNERLRRLAKLEAERESRQRQRYLDRFRIDRASIKGIGRSRTSMLASFGIETAAEVDERKIMQIPGFGRELTYRLVRWRRTLEQNFRFNPNEPIDRRDIDSIDRELDICGQSLISALREGPHELSRLRQEIQAGRTRLMPMLEQAWTSLKVAELRRQRL